MNWTGGTLSRHSKRGQNALVEKQKQHFANARAKQQTLRGIPSRPKIFGEEIDQDEIAAKSSRHASNTSIQRQSRLEAFDDFAPVVNRLSSMTPRSATQTRVVSKRAAKGHQESTPSGIARQSEHQSAKRKRSEESAVTSRSTGQGAVIYDENELDRQKRQLLTKRDWVGLQAPSSLHMDFVSDRGNENFGKRRRVEPQLAPDRDYNKRAYVSSIRENPGPHIDADMSGSVQIRIGDDALTSRMSQTQGIRSPAGRVSSQPPSSSSMLFDDHAQVVTEPRHQTSNIPRHIQEGIRSDSPLARLNPNTLTREEFVEATDEEYGNSSKYDWPTSSDYGRAVPKVHELEVHSLDHVADSLPLEDQTHMSSERQQEYDLIEDMQSVPDTSDRPKDSNTAAIQKETAQPIKEYTDHAWKPSIQLLPDRPKHSPPEMQKRFVKPRLLTRLSPAPPSPKTITKQTQPAVNTSIPPTPASLAALNALCQTRAPPPPTKPAPKVEVDQDAIWKAFVFGNPKSPSTTDEASTHNLTRTSKPSTASMEVRPPTPTRKQRSSSILTSIPSDSNHADARTTAATVAHSSSNGFQSDERTVNDYLVSKTQLSPSKTIATVSNFDRVSSVANASTIPAVLRTGLPVFRRSSPDPLIVDHDRAHRVMAAIGTAKKQTGFKKPKIIFNRPRPFEGADPTTEERYEIVHVGHGGGRRAREILKDAEGEGGEVEDIEEV